jgi:hypothetical protein
MFPSTSPCLHWLKRIKALILAYHAVCRFTITGLIAKLFSSIESLGGAHEVCHGNGAGRVTVSNGCAFSSASTACSMTALNRPACVASIFRQTTGEFFSVWEYKRNFHDSLIRR